MVRRFESVGAIIETDFGAGHATRHRLTDRTTHPGIEDKINGAGSSVYGFGWDSSHFD